MQYTTESGQEVSVPDGSQLLPADTSRYSDPVFTFGGDIVCPATLATAFGGPADSGDDGQTASGISTRDNLDLVGCALPMPHARGCHGTPLATLPWGTLVRVRLGDATADVPLIDVGPAGGLKPCRMIDLTIGAWAKLLGRIVAAHEVNNLSARVSFMISGGKKYQTDYFPAGAICPCCGSQKRAAQ